MKNKLCRIFLFTIMLSLVACTIGEKEDMVTIDYRRYINTDVPTLYAYPKSINLSTGKVEIRGGDNSKLEKSFHFIWGDGIESDGNFPQEHVYSNCKKNYVVKVEVRYSDESLDYIEVFVRFVAPYLDPVSLDSKITVTIPDSQIELGSRLPLEGMYEFSKSLSFFTDEFFPEISRETISYVLSIAASIQMDLVNDNVYMENNTFRQVLLRDAGIGGMYSLWYTNPVSFGVGDYGLRESIQWSSFFHEMGHNFTLNTPANYYFGGKIDGNANAIYSETMAQIFQHVTAYSIVNKYEDYGLSEDLAYEIQLSALASFSGLLSSYKRYINSGKNFASWNDPNTPQDETFDTFMTIAYKFFEHAEKGKPDYKNQLKRMMKFLQQFNEDWRRRYDPKNNSVAGSTFRVTLMVSALSYACDEDLRAEFRELHFPISNEIYLELIKGIN